MPFLQATGSRRADITRLDKEPQKNMAVVRAILTAAIKDMQARLKKLEKTFYGPKSKNGVEALSKWGGAVKAVLAVAQRSTVSTSHQLDDIFRQAADPKYKFSLDAHELNKVKEVYRKTMDAVPLKFIEFIKDIKAIVKHMVKYCLSFYDTKDGGVYLDTGHNYEKQRGDFQKTINENIDVISQMPQKFKSSALFASDFSPSIVEMARKSDCSHAPFLLLFPAAVECIHNACSTLMSWIDNDDNYALFISNDIKDLERKKSDVEKVAQEQYQRYHGLLFRIKQLQTECEQLTTELDKLAEKDNELTVEEEYLTNESNDMQVDIENKEYRRDELLKNAGHLHPEVLYEKYNEVSENLRELKFRLPFVKRQLAAVQYKLSWIGQKKEELSLEDKKREEVQKEMAVLEQARQEHEAELEQIASVLAKARQIYVYKSSPDVVEKVFQGRPVEINTARLPGHRDKNDPFERTCQVVAGVIDRDWPRLYRALPFYPPRGDNTIDDDVKEFSWLTAGMGTPNIALRCLHRWRRFHTRARVEDLMATLRAIHRHDILHSIDAELNPPRPPTPKEEVYPDFLEEHLIPFWKEVERFDQLRAANKI